MNDSQRSSTDPAYVRALGGFERGIDLMETVNGDAHPVRVIAFDGSLDTELFQRALRNLVQRRPLLMTRIVRPLDEKPYFARDERWPPVTVVERRDGEHWRAEFERQLSTPVSAARNDALLRLTALVGDSAGEIVLACHHAVCDGRSLTAFCRDLVHEYEWLRRGAPGDPAALAGTVSPPMEDILPPGLTGSQGRDFLEGFSARVRDRLSSPPGYILERPDVPEAPPGRHLLSRELPPDTTRALVSMARANGATVGGAISAAILRAGMDTGGPDAEDALGLMTNVDVRPYLRENVPLQNMGAYAASSFGFYPGARTKPFWTLAREVTEAVRSSIESLDVYGSALLAEQGYKAYVYEAVLKNWPQFMVANLGRMDLPQPDEAFRVRNIHGGGLVYGILPFFFCSAVGMGDSIVIDVNYQTPATPHDLAREFDRALLDRLLTEVGPVPAQSARH